MQSQWCPKAKSVVNKGYNILSLKEYHYICSLQYANSKQHDKNPSKSNSWNNIHLGSVAYEKLKDALTKKKLVKAIKQASSVAQTSCLEE